MKSHHTSNKCPSCSAKIDLRTQVNGLVTCNYCDHQYSVVTPPGSHSRPILTDTSHTSSSQPKKRIILPLAASLLVLGIGIASFVFLLGSQESDTSQGTATVAGLAARSFVGSRESWDDVGGPPQIVSIGGEEHVVGRMRVYGEDNLNVRVFRSKDLTQRWATPVLGTYGEAYRSIHFAATAGRLLVSDKSNKLHVYALKSGKELKTHALTDRVEQLCVVEQAGKVWVKTLDKRNILFDVSSFEVEEAAQRPAECPRHARMARRHSSQKVRRSDYPKVENFKARRLFVESDHAVVFGAKKPGTPIPIAVGFDPTSKQLRWNKTILQVDPSSFRTSFYAWLGGLAGGRFVTYYGVGSDDEWRAVAFDADSGDLLWEKVLRPISGIDKIDNMLLSKKYVYLVRTSSLEVLNAATGQLVGTVGSERYD